MLTRCIRAEWLKLRRTRMWLILFILPLIGVMIGSVNYYFNQQALQNGWYSLWTQVCLFYGEFFLPVLIAICCAFVCRLEHVNKNWNAVMTAPLPVSFVFIAKLVVVTLLLLVVHLFFTALYAGAGLLFGLSFPLPGEIAGWVARGWLASITIAAIQLWLSLRIRSFAVPIGISICAVFVGLGMYVAKAGMFFPYSLLTIGMGALSQEPLSASESGLFVVMNVIFLFIVSVAAIRKLKSTDVIA
ncbi:ABC transporter permease [Paenibacillus sp. GCM10027626]|uniref:ABC transporter permease n=1 Tax=Paenibacillus sp. GCM10027626 TaxID=3273411 RepID=UPI0036278B50